MKPILMLSVCALALSACASKDVSSTFANQPFVEAKVIDEPLGPVEAVEKVKPLPPPEGIVDVAAFPPRLRPPVS